MSGARGPSPGPVHDNAAARGASCTYGKWSLPGVPHKGWSCVDVEDLGGPLEICDMCESAEIRFVHYMSHPDYSETLGVGCVCAENMEDDYTSPRARERALRSKSRRRKSWGTREWRLSAKGNSYLNTEGFNLVVFRKDDPGGCYWGFKVESRKTGRNRFSQKRYPTEALAKHATLEALIWAKQHP
jgi:hypothetical protein